MKKILLALVLIPSLAFGAGWDETVTSPQPDDTVMINDVSQPDGSKTQYTSLQRLPVSDLTTTELNSKVSLNGDQTVNGIKNFTSSPVIPEPVSDSQAATKFYVDNNGGAGGPATWGAITGTLSDQDDLNTALLGKVNTTGSENINGVKTFLLSPIVPTPVSGTDAANKDYVDANAGGGGGVWGTITGTLSNQTDLQDALNQKAPALTLDDNYVTDAEKAVIEQTSGVNTGDQDLSNYYNVGDDIDIGKGTGTSLTIDPVDSGKVVFTPITVGETGWVIGSNNNSNGTSDDPFEIRTSTTPGQGVRMTVNPSGDVHVTGNLTVDGSAPGSEPSLEVQDEGLPLSASTSLLNFAGAGVTATEPGNEGQILITIPGGGGEPLEVQDEGSSLSTATNLLNFAGAGVTASEPGPDGQILITIPGGTGDPGTDSINTTGTIQGRLSVVDDAAGTSIDKDQMGGTIFDDNGGTWALANIDAADGTGWQVCVYASTATPPTIDIVSTDKIRYAGVLGAAGVGITAPAEAGSMVCLVVTDFDGDTAHWTSFGTIGTWTVN